MALRRETAATRAHCSQRKDTQFGLDTTRRSRLLRPYFPAQGWENRFDLVKSTTVVP